MVGTVSLHEEPVVVDVVYDVRRTFHNIGKPVSDDGFFADPVQSRHIGFRLCKSWGCLSALVFCANLLLLITPCSIGAWDLSAPCQFREPDREQPVLQDEFWLHAAIALSFQLFRSCRIRLRSSTHPVWLDRLGQ